MSEFKLPTETIELPSKGLLYPKDNPLSEGKVELKYMTAREEDILTNQNYIKNGTVIDRLLKSLIISKINYEDLLIGDKNALMVSARILSYGKDYEFEYEGVEQNIDLSLLEPIPMDESLYETGNSFSFTLPHTENVVTFKVLTHKDERAIDNESKGLKKIKKNESSEVTTRFNHIITSINGSSERKDIREFVNNYLLAKDARALRLYYKQINPDLDMNVVLTNSEGEEEVVDLPMGLSFFWPDF